MKGLGKVRAGAVLVASGALLAFAATAQAQRPPSLGDGAPSGQSGIQLYNFSNYLSNGAGRDHLSGAAGRSDAVLRRPPAPTTSAGRLERVFAFLQSRGHQATSSSTAIRATRSRAPTRRRRSTSPAWRRCARSATSTACASPAATATCTEANWDNQIAASKILGQDHIGESGFPGGAGALQHLRSGSLNTAQLLNRLGKRSVEAGLGPAYFHNHQQEFQTALHLDNGVLKSAWEIIMERTDPRWVVAQIDIGWAVCGASGHRQPGRPRASARRT